MPVASADDVAQIIGAVADLLWPVLAFVAIFVFRSELASLSQRITLDAPWARGLLIAGLGGSGYQHWVLSDAQGGTFVDMEMGIKDPESPRFALFDKTIGRWFIKRWAEQAIDGLRRTLTSSPTS